MKNSFIPFAGLLTALFLSGRIEAQIISTYAGNGNMGFSGNGGQATSAQLNNPTCVGFDAAGNAYIADYNNHQVRMVNALGIITAFAGSSLATSLGDGGPAINAQLNLPSVVIFDGADNAYIADAANHCIRKVTPAGIITTIAGTPGSLGYSGDGGPATSAKLAFPCGLLLDAAGNLYIADRDNGSIRKVTPSGIISTVAGVGVNGMSGDGGPATSAQLYFPNGVDFDQSGNLYIADKINHRIRKVDASGIITTWAGTGTSGLSGDGGQAINAQFNMPFGVTFDIAGNAFICDWGNMRIRKITPAGVISTYVGTTQGYSGDGGPAASAQINYSEKVSFDHLGNMYIPDAENYRIRKVTCPSPVNSVSITSSRSMICPGESVTLQGHGAPGYHWGPGKRDSVLVVSPTVTTTYTVIGFNEMGCRRAAVFTQNVATCTGIESVAEQEGLILSPNPAKASLTLLGKSQADVWRIRIMDVTGKTVYSGEARGVRTSVDISALPASVYMVEMRSGEQLLRKKLVVE